MGTKVLHFVFDVRFTFFSSVGLPESPGYLLCFIVLEFHDELPLREDGSHLLSNYQEGRDELNLAEFPISAIGWVIQ